MKTTYNYYCLNINCKLNHTIRVTKDDTLNERNEFCLSCNEPLKRMGVHTSIVHVGTQESKVK